MSTILRAIPLLLAAGLAAVAALAAGPAGAAEFSVTPIRVELKPGALSETITIINHLPQRLRVSARLMAWTQDAAGNDVYRDSTDLIFFPRQLEVEGNGKRLLRVGGKAPAMAAESAYRLYIEEEPEPAEQQGTARVVMRFRFGVPVFVPPPGARPVADVGQPTLSAGKLSVVVRNSGTSHFRLVRVAVSDAGSFSREIAGWYSLAGTERTYTVDIPPDVCRRAPALNVTLEGEGIKIERTLNVAPAHCG